MRHATASLLIGRLLAFTLLVVPALNAHALVIFEWSTVGDAGNAADTLVMDKCPSTGCMGDGTTGYGSVDYEFQISTKHVTVSQYTEFLNSVDPDGANPLNLYNSRMDTWFNPVSFEPATAYSGGIKFDAGAATGNKYLAKNGRENNPATWVSWVSAARFVNWLSNGQGASDTEMGVYNNLPVTTNDPIPTREAGATIFLPTENEFYKAAYYNPTLNGGAGDYTEYGVGNSAPVVEGPSGGAASANLAQTDGVDGPSGDTYWQTGGSNFNDTLDYLTEAGAYSSATSYYGLFDVDGNAYQWLEASRPNRFNTEQDLPLFRGGSWLHGADASGAAYRNSQFFATGSTSLSSNYHGFRVAQLVQVEVLEGDFNGDGTVNLADYTVWRDTLGATVANSGDGADGNANGVVDAADYVVWKNHFAQTAATGQLATAFNTVPEPACVTLVLLAVGGLASFTIKRCQSSRN